jgi:hypothetical protein
VATVLVNAHCFEGCDPLATADTLQNAPQLVALLIRQEPFHGLSDSLCGGVAVQALGTRIPVRDNAVQGTGQDCVSGRIDNGREFRAEPASVRFVCVERRQPQSHSTVQAVVD